MNRTLKSLAVFLGGIALGVAAAGLFLILNSSITPEEMQAWDKDGIVPGLVMQAGSIGFGVWFLYLVGLVTRAKVRKMPGAGFGKIARAVAGYALMILLAIWFLWRMFIQHPEGVLINPTLFAQYVVDGIRLGFVYALISLGYTMVYGIVRLINFAHGDVFMVGAFTSFFAIKAMRLHLLPAQLFPSLSPWVAITIGTVLVIILSMVVCMLLAVVIERVAYKPLRNAPRIAALITAIGVSFFLEYFSSLPEVFTSNYIIYEQPFKVVSWKILGVQISNVTIIIILVSILFLLLLRWIVYGTKLGKAMRATSWDKPTARLMGIDVDGVITKTFAIGAALAGAGGVLYAIAYPQLIVFMGIMPGLKAFVAAVLGGIGNLNGAFVGSLIMGQAEMLSAGYILTPMRDAIAFTILIIVLMIRPTGIFGEPEGEKA
jgi:branched-chain amino acid transport system permease protein